MHVHMRVDMYDSGILTCQTQIKFFLMQQVMIVNRPGGNNRATEAGRSFLSERVSYNCPALCRYSCRQVAPPHVFGSEDPLGRVLKWTETRGPAFQL